jgi:hypothetical protein
MYLQRVWREHRVFRACGEERYRKALHRETTELNDEDFTKAWIGDTLGDKGRGDRYDLF